MLSHRRKRVSMTAIAMELTRIISREREWRLARATGKCTRTARNWLDGKTHPSAPDLVNILAEFPHLISEVVEFAGQKVVTQSQYDAAKQALKILEGG